MCHDSPRGLVFVEHVSLVLRWTIASYKRYKNSMIPGEQSKHW